MGKDAEPPHPQPPLLRGGGEGGFDFARGSPGWRHARVRGGEVVGFLESDCEGERVELEGTSVSYPGLVSDTPSGFLRWSGFRRRAGELWLAAEGAGAQVPGF